MEKITIFRDSTLIGGSNYDQYNLIKQQQHQIRQNQLLNNYNNSNNYDNSNISDAAAFSAATLDLSKMGNDIFKCWCLKTTTFKQLLDDATRFYQLKEGTEAHLGAVFELYDIVPNTTNKYKPISVQIDNSDTLLHTLAIYEQHKRHSDTGRTINNDEKKKTAAAVNDYIISSSSDDDDEDGKNENINNEKLSNNIYKSIYKSSCSLSSVCIRLVHHINIPSVRPSVSSPPSILDDNNKNVNNAFKKFRLSRHSSMPRMSINQPPNIVEWHNRSSPLNGVEPLTLTRNRSSPLNGVERLTLSPSPQPGSGRVLPISPPLLTDNKGHNIHATNKNDNNDYRSRVNTENTCDTTDTFIEGSSSSNNPHNPHGDPNNRNTSRNNNDDEYYSSQTKKLRLAWIRSHLTIYEQLYRTYLYYCYYENNGGQSHSIISRNIDIMTTTYGIMKFKQLKRFLKDIRLSSRGKIQNNVPYKYVNKNNCNLMRKNPINIESDQLLILFNKYSIPLTTLTIDTNRKIYFNNKNIDNNANGITFSSFLDILSDISVKCFLYNINKTMVNKNNINHKYLQRYKYSQNDITDAFNRILTEHILNLVTPTMSTMASKINTRVNKNFQNQQKNTHLKKWVLCDIKPFINPHNIKSHNNTYNNEYSQIDISNNIYNLHYNILQSSYIINIISHYSKPLSLLFDAYSALYQKKKKLKSSNQNPQNWIGFNVLFQLYRDFQLQQDMGVTSNELAILFISCSNNTTNLNDNINIYFREHEKNEKTTMKHFLPSLRERMYFAGFLEFIGRVSLISYTNIKNTNSHKRNLSRISTTKAHHNIVKSTEKRMF